MDARSVSRYSRQALLPQIRASGQQALQRASVLVVGAGGIGSTAIMYLAGAGVGRITVVDHDVVEESNLHRQVIHDVARLGVNKALSAVQSVRSFNPLVWAEAVAEKFTAVNALQLVSQHDIVVDATDNVTARYVINDACVLAKKPLFSGSAIGFEGQVAVFDSRVGPCYRCLYARLSPAEACKSCTDSGVLGPVPGTIGNMQAIEVIKYITNCGESLLGRQLYFDALNAEWHSFVLPPKLASCRICGENADIKTMEQSEESVAQQLCALSKAPVEIPDVVQVTAQEFAEIRKEGRPHVLLDVRERLQYELVNLPESRSLPLSTIDADALPIVQQLRKDGDIPVYCICRRGIASRTAVRRLLDMGVENVYNVIGGLNAWHREVDQEFPFY